MDDAEIIRQSLNYARNTGALSLQLDGGQQRVKSQTQEKLQKTTSAENEISEEEAEEMVAKVELFSKGYAVITEYILQKEKDGFFQAHSELDAIPVEALLLDDETFEEGVGELINNRFDCTISLIEIFEYDEDKLVNLYEVAEQFYNEAQIECAILAFTFLTYVHPNISSFWRGLGLSYERSQNMNEAVKAYKQSTIQAADFIPYYDMIRSCETTGNFNEVLELLKNLKEKNLFQEEVDDALLYISQLKHS